VRDRGQSRWTFGRNHFGRFCGFFEVKWATVKQNGGRCSCGSADFARPTRSSSFPFPPHEHGEMGALRRLGAWNFLPFRSTTDTLNFLRCTDTLRIHREMHYYNWRGVGRLIGGGPAGEERPHPPAKGANTEEFMNEPQYTGRSSPTCHDHGLEKIGGWKLKAKPMPFKKKGRKNPLDGYSPGFGMGAT